MHCQNHALCKGECLTDSENTLQLCASCLTHYLAAPVSVPAPLAKLHQAALLLDACRAAPDGLPPGAFVAAHRRLESAARAVLGLPALSGTH